MKLELLLYYKYCCWCFSNFCSRQRERKLGSNGICHFTKLMPQNIKFHFHAMHVLYLYIKHTLILLTNSSSLKHLPNSFPKSNWGSSFYKFANFEPIKNVILLLQHQFQIGCAKLINKLMLLYKNWFQRESEFNSAIIDILIFLRSEVWSHYLKKKMIVVNELNQKWVRFEIVTH